MVLLILGPYIENCFQGILFCAKYGFRKYLFERIGDSVSLHPLMHEQLQVNASYRQIVKIAFPIALAMFVPQINFITNNIFLGHLNENALAAASITGVYYLVFSSIGFGLNNGLQALISRRAGENRPEEIGKIFNQGVLIS